MKACSTPRAASNLSVETCSAMGSSPSPQKPMVVEHRKRTASPRNAARLRGSQSAHWPGVWPGVGTTSRERPPQASVPPAGTVSKGISSASKLREWSQMTSASSSDSAAPKPSARRRAAIASRQAGTAKRRMSASTPSGTTRRAPASESSRARPVWSMWACVKKTVAPSGSTPRPSRARMRRVSLKSSGVPESTTSVSSPSRTTKAFTDGRNVSCMSSSTRQTSGASSTRWQMKPSPSSVKQFSPQPWPQSPSPAPSMCVPPRSGPFFSPV